MDCEKMRDRFSSLWEKELTPVERKTVEEHLSSCPACRREFEQFEKAMQWLHSAGEVEVPDQFLPELLKKIEERKRITPDKKATERWFNFPRSFKLPAQAVAMVAIVFLVLYITKMMPTREYGPKETEEASSRLPLEKKPAPELAQKEGERGRVALKTPSETSPPKDVEQAETAVVGKERLEAYAPQVKAEEKKAEVPFSKTEVMREQKSDSVETARAGVPSSEPGKIERESVVLEKSVVASEPPQEIVLRISDREKAIFQLHKLVKQFGGEIVATEGDRFFASLPKGSFSEFGKELTELSASTHADKLFARKPDTGDLMAVEGVKKEEVGKKGKESATLADDVTHRIIVRILLVQE